MKIIDDGPPMTADGQVLTRAKMKAERSTAKARRSARRAAVDARRDRRQKAEVQAAIDAAVAVTAASAKAAKNQTVRRQNEQFSTAAGSLKALTFPIRVGFITPAIAMGGAEMWILSLLQHLDRERFSIGGVAATTWDQSQNDPSICRQFAKHGSVHTGRTSAQRLQSHCDLLIAWGCATLPQLVAGFRGPVVMVSHGGCDWTRLIMAKGMGAATHLAAVSQAAAKGFPEELLDGRRIEIVHNGIDAGRCRQRRSREEVRRLWGLRPDEIAIGYVGRFSPEKRPVAAAMAVARLREPFRAVYIGGGWKRRETIAAVRKIRPAAIIWPAVSQVGDIYRAMDCFVLASPSEGFSLSLTEAWYCGLPTVATPVGAVPELEEQFGPLTVRVPVAASSRDLAAAVRRAVSDENREVVERAQRVAAEHFTAAAMGRRWGDYLERVASCRE